VLASPVYGQDAADSDAEQQPDETNDRFAEIHGRFRAGAELRAADGSSDINLDQSLQLRVTFPDHPKIAIDASLWLHEDLDGDESRSSPLRGINDGYDSNFRARLLHLYVEADDVWGRSTLRVGRQRILESPNLARVDGVYYKQYFAKGDWYVFGGARASIYESSSDEASIGGGVSWRPNTQTRLALDLHYGEDDRSRGEEVYRGIIPELLGSPYPRRVRSDVDNNQIAVSIWQRLTDNLQVYGRFSLMDGDADELSVQVTGFAPTLDLTYLVSYRRHFERTEDRIDELSMFYRSLGAYEEYDHLLVSLSRPLSEKYTASLDVEFHEADDGRNNRANRDYQRYAATIRGENVFKNTDVSLGLEWWNVNAGEGTTAVTGEITKRWEKWRLTVGADYSRYEHAIISYERYPSQINRAATAFIRGHSARYRPWVNRFDTRRREVSEDIHTLYATLKWTIDSKQDVTARLSVEEDDGPDSPYWRLRIGYGIRF
jgi:hypothetical protein